MSIPLIALQFSQTKCQSFFATYYKTDTLNIKKTSESFVIVSCKTSECLLRVATATISFFASILNWTHLHLVIENEYVK